jgi:putative MATE family efflux protein
MAPMRDLTQGPVERHVLRLAAFIGLTTLFQTLYFLADLYFVGRLGKEAVAGVGLAGNLMLVVLAMTLSLGAGTTSLVAQALGRRDRARAQLVFNQAVLLSLAGGLAFFAVAFPLRGAYARWLSADALTAAQGQEYLTFFVPALALQFPLVVMSAALRGSGDMKVPTVIQVAGVALNITLAPLLMFGWISRPLGVTGAAVASLVSIAAGSLAVAAYFHRPASPLRFCAEDWRPRTAIWAGLLRIGLPAGGEFALMSVYAVLVYGLIRPFGAAAQAGFGIGMRVVQALVLPVVAIAFAAAPVAAQNFGARLGERVRRTFYSAAAMATVVMLAQTLLCRAGATALVGVFSADPAVVAYGAEYLRIVAWNFAATGIVFVSSNVFQGMGNTLPPLFSSALRLVLFAACAVALSRQPSFQLAHLWYLAVATVVVQFASNLWLLQREFARRLGPALAAPAPAARAVG